MSQGLLPGYLFAVGASICYALAQVMSRFVVQEMAHPLMISVYSFFFGTVFLLLFLLPRLPREMASNNSRRGLLLFTAMGVTGGLAVTALFTALRHSPVAVVSSVSGANPLFALLLTYLFLRHLEQVSLRIVLGAILVVAGVVLVTLSQI